MRIITALTTHTVLLAIALFHLLNSNSLALLGNDGKWSSDEDLKKGLWMLGTQLGHRSQAEG